MEVGDKVRIIKTPVFYRPYNNSFDLSTLVGKEVVVVGFIPNLWGKGFFENLVNDSKSKGQGSYLLDIPNAPIEFITEGVGIEYLEVKNF